jgi:hypothetical protein
MAVLHRAGGLRHRTGVHAALGRATAQIAGLLARISIARLEAAKRNEPKIHDVLARYADCLTAQVLQSAGCATLHPLEARYAHWLLMMHDRLRQPELPLTQESLAQMFGVARTYVTTHRHCASRPGAITYRRGIIRTTADRRSRNRPANARGWCRDILERVLPGLYPTEELGRGLLVDLITGNMPA